MLAAKTDRWQCPDKYSVNLFPLQEDDIFLVIISLKKKVEAPLLTVWKKLIQY